MRKTQKIAFLLVVFTLFATITAQAEIVEIAITATVKSVTDEGNFLEGKIIKGSIITGSYKYESTTPDANPLPNGADYWHYSSPYGMFLSVSGFDFKTDLTNVNFLIEIINNYPPDDDYLVRSSNNLPLSESVGVGRISWWLSDPTGTALASTVLPVTAPILNQWQSNDLFINGGGIGGGGNYSFHAEVTSAEVVPEPGTLLLLGIGAASIRLLIRKKSRQH